MYTPSKLGEGKGVFSGAPPIASTIDWVMYMYDILGPANSVGQPRYPPRRFTWDLDHPSPPRNPVQKDSQNSPWEETDCDGANGRSFPRLTHRISHPTKPRRQTGSVTPGLIPHFKIPAGGPPPRSDIPYLAAYPPVGIPLDSTSLSIPTSL